MPVSSRSHYRVQLPVPARVVVLVSGTGTLLQALLDAAADPAYPAAVVAVGADRSGIAGLDRAARAGVPTFVESLRAWPDRAAWNTALTDAVLAHRPDLVISAGFMTVTATATNSGRPHRIHADMRELVVRVFRSSRMRNRSRMV